MLLKKLYDTVQYRTVQKNNLDFFPHPYNRHQTLTIPRYLVFFNLIYKSSVDQAGICDLVPNYLSYRQLINKRLFLFFQDEHLRRKTALLTK